MIDYEKRQAFITGTRSGADAVIDLVKQLTQEDIDTLCLVIDELRPQRSLSEMNLEHELIDQYRKVKTLQDDVMTDEDVPANQRAQVANAVATVLQQLVKAQSEYYTAERFKAIEAMVIKAIRKLPKEVAEAFIDEYERIGE